MESGVSVSFEKGSDGGTQCNARLGVHMAVVVEVFNN
jgi:hypothetical protein